MNTRTIAVRILIEVIQKKRSLPAAFEKILLPGLSQRDVSQVKQFCFGVLRYYHRLWIIVQGLMYKPLKNAHKDVEILILLGLYQLIYLNTPQYAAVSETVASANDLKKPWMKGLVNQALQNYLRHSAKYMEKADSTLTGKFSHPEWLIAQLRKDWPVEWQSILTANNTQAPMFLRINPQRISREKYLEKLKQQQIESLIIEELPHAIQLSSGQSVESLPGFYEGEFSVQDLASQYLYKILDIKDGQRVLDACAAPGGKTSLILENFPQLKEIIAIEKESERADLIQENLRRLQLTERVKVITADAAEPNQWWDGVAFDWILLDAPCSGTGVIRRHPDIKLLRQPEDIAAYHQQQIQLLSQLWPLLNPGGKLLYTTCSVLKEENENVIKNFCLGCQEAAIKYSHQLLPVENGPDGFYYVLLTFSK